MNQYDFDNDGDNAGFTIPVLIIVAILALFFGALLV